jgi:2-oxoglutarate dehydrogenase E1 component
LIKNDVFNNFLKDRFLTKRFGIEGCDSFISGLESMVEHGANKGIKNIVIGMPHRGRLNTLYQVLGKPLEEIMTEF